MVARYRHVPRVNKKSEVQQLKESKKKAIKEIEKAERKAYIKSPEYIAKLKAKREYNILYSSWHAMKQRCYYTKHSAYKWYGGKGSKVCDEWINDYGAYREWAMSAGWYKGCNISRKNDTGDYSPTNCEIKSKKDNIDERDIRKPVKIIKGKVEKTFGSMSEASQFIGCTTASVANVLNPKQNNKTVYGWNVENL